MAPSPSDPLLSVWFALGLVFALIVGVSAGLLGWLGGQAAAIAVLTGGASFGGTVTLVVGVIILLRR